MNQRVISLVCAVMLAGLNGVSNGLAQQATVVTGEVARFTFGQTRAALSAIEAEMRAARPEQFPALEERFLKLIQASDSTPDCKDWACRQLRFVGSEKSLDTLAGLLASKELATVARQVLLTMPGKAVDKVLTEAVGKVDGALKAGLLQTIGERKVESAVGVVAAELTARDEAVAASALAALGSIGTDAALTALKGATVPASLKVGRAKALLGCADRLLVAGNRKDAAAAYAAVLADCEYAPVKAAALRGVFAADVKAARPLAESLLKAEPAKLRTIAASSLSECSDASELQPLFANLAALPADVRVTLITLAKEKALLPRIIEAAGAGEAEVRCAAITAVGRLGDASHVPMLLKLAVTESDSVQAAARSSLPRISDKGAGAVLVTNAKSGESAARVESIKALKARGDSSVTPELFALVADGDGAVRVESFAALGELAGASDLQAVIKLLKETKPENAGAAEQALIAVCRRMPDAEAAASAVGGALAGADAKIKAALLRVIGTVKSAKSVEILKANVNDSDATVKDAAIRCMANWPDASLIADVLALAGKAESPVHKVVALRGAVRMIGLKSDRPLQETVKLLSDAMALAQNADAKKLVLAAVADVTHKSALDMAVNCLSDGDLEVEAAMAVMKIAGNLGAKNKDSLAAVKKIQEVCKSEQAKKIGTEPLTPSKRR